MFRFGMISLNGGCRSCQEDFKVNIVAEFLKYQFDIFLIAENLIMHENIGYSMYLDRETLRGTDHQKVTNTFNSGKV